MTANVRPIRDIELAQMVEYAYASVADTPLRCVWVAGACPLDVDGRTVAVGDYAGQRH